MKALLTIAYDGTDYCGWQRQKNQRTVQQVVEEALSSLYKTNITILGASRTDAGVHAKCQKATFTPPHYKIPESRLPLAVSAFLPNDIRVKSCENKPDSFHVINDVKQKTYEYAIENAQVFCPMRSRYYCFVNTPLNFELMTQAAAHFIGTHDFKSFCSTNSVVKTTVRTVYSLSLNKSGDTIKMEICGSGFLYNMVRIIAGTLINVGEGKIDSEAIPSIIKNGDRTKAGKTAPAKGLTLVDIKY